MESREGGEKESYGKINHCLLFIWVEIKLVCLLVNVFGEFSRSLKTLKEKGWGVKQGFSKEIDLFLFSELP